jgi:hypothetical protein
MDLNGLGSLSYEICRNGPFLIYHFPSMPFLHPKDDVHLKMAINSPIFHAHGLAQYAKNFHGTRT